MAMVKVRRDSWVKEKGPINGSHYERVLPTASVGKFQMYFGTMRGWYLRGRQTYFRFGNVINYFGTSTITIENDGSRKDC